MAVDPVTGVADAISAVAHVIEKLIDYKILKMDLDEINSIKSLEADIRDERKKGDDADQALIEDNIAEISALEDSLWKKLALYGAKTSGAVTK